MNDYATVKDGLPYFPGMVVGIDIHVENTATFNKSIKGNYSGSTTMMLPANQE